MTGLIAIRVDASRVIGSGHVMRCLTLAEAMAARGGEIRFICRAHPGHLGSVIKSRGFRLDLLPEAVPAYDDSQGGAAGDPPHSQWLGVDFRTDAEQCIHLLGTHRTDLLVVDHYGLDARWEALLRPVVGNIMVIDDLADRAHDCDVLLDQNLGRRSEDYDGCVPPACRRLIGPAHALLRSEFASLRATSLARRADGNLRRILVSLGGVDLPNATGQVLMALSASPLAQGLEVLVVMGSGAPWISHVQAQVRELSLKAEIKIGIGDMAAQMCAADLSIGAAGGTAWERCCLGLPTILVVLADNQQSGAAALERAGAAHIIGAPDEIPFRLPDFLTRLAIPDSLLQMQVASARITDGQGVGRVIKTLEDLLV
jgi:UDP-2,4-diacetamido-2,4,6-trideoxy-beta-L-altropyranose hydrolase